MERQIRWLRQAAALLILLIATAMPSISYAGGVAILLDEAPKDVRANVAFTVGFTIRSAHEGRMLQPDLKPLLLASRVGSAEQVTATAVEEGDPGHYRVTLTLPTAGTWQWEIVPFAPEDQTYRLMLPGPLQVQAEGAVAPAGQQVDATKVQDAKAVDNLFIPIDTSVAAGTTITWHNLGELPHTVTAANGLFSSGNLEPGAEWSYTFAEPGTYIYYCQYHAAKPAAAADAVVVPAGVRPGDNGYMLGKIIVTAPAVAGTDAAVAPEPTAPVLAQVAVAPDEAAGAATVTLPRTASPATPYVLIGLVALLASSLGLLLRRRIGA